MKDNHGNEFTHDTVHCWNCVHYQDYENSDFSWCTKNKACLPMVQLKTLNPVTCVKFEKIVRPLKIKIIKCSSPSYWYNDRVGEILEVSCNSYHDEYMYPLPYYCTGYIEKQDCKIIKE